MTSDRLRLQRLVAVQATPIALPQPGKPRKLIEPSALVTENNIPLTSVDEPSIGLAAAYPKPREDVTDAEHGPGMHWTFGTILRLRPGKVCDPEQPLKLCPTVMLVTVSPGEIVKAMG
jgi:hypothetical protein